MAHIIVSDALDVSEPHGQDRLRAIQRLNLTLFIHTQHQSVVGRVEVQADDVSHLLDEEWIGRKFESARAMRLQREGLDSRCTVDLKMPLSRAASRTVQCVLPAGLPDSVRFRRAATRSSSMVRGRPGCTSSYKPATLPSPHSCVRSCDATTSVLPHGEGLAKPHAGSRLHFRPAHGPAA